MGFVGMGALVGDETPRRVSAPRGMTRRELLRALGVGAPGIVLLNGCVPEPSPEHPLPVHDQPDPAPFLDGVMAGDPQPDGTIIWTRVAAAADAEPVGVIWSVATDPEFATIVAGGTEVATAERGHTVKVRVTDLASDRWYWYRFEALGVASRTGRLRTAPALDAQPDRLRFAFGSCQQLNDSWFVAHRAVTEEPNLDFFLHLGDFVYADDRASQTLGDYRNLYRRWRREPLLRDFNAKLPMVAMWDDGEFYNGVDRFGPPARLTAASRAWFESMPVAEIGGRAWRTMSWGALADLPVIDVRSQRDPAIAEADRTKAPGSDAYLESRSQLGAEQALWLRERLLSSAARWRIVGSGVPVNPWRLVNLEFLRLFQSDLPPNAGLYASADGWDDYVAERTGLLRSLAAEGVHDTVFATAHTHIAMASDLRVDPDAGGPIVGHDLVAPSMTADPDVVSAYLGDLPRDAARSLLRIAEGWVLNQNPGMRHLNLEDQGYVVMDVTPDEIVAEYRMIDTFDPNAEAYTAARFRIVPGGTRMEVLRPTHARGSFR